MMNWMLTRRIIEWGAAALILLFLFPLLTLLSILVLLDLGRPVIFRQTRAGLNGTPFEILKFRTMHNSAPGKEDCGDEAKRITRLGEFLRSTSLDELPSFVNVLAGHMSFIGPRPLPIEYVSKYSLAQLRRLTVRPGITGWAQVNGRNLLSWDRRFELDLWYIDHKSLKLDLKILLLTIVCIFRRSGINARDGKLMTKFRRLGE
jgi:lipopolysaccharide/colanic/teichoic acid biosynthesis glycosyltransferase